MALMLFVPASPPGSSSLLPLPGALRLHPHFTSTGSDGSAMGASFSRNYFGFGSWSAIEVASLGECQETEAQFLALPYSGLELNSSVCSLLSPDLLCQEEFSRSDFLVSFPSPLWTGTWDESTGLGSQLPSLPFESDSAPFPFNAPQTRVFFARVLVFVCQQSSSTRVHVDTVSTSSFDEQRMLLWSWYLSWRALRFSLAYYRRSVNFILAFVWACWSSIGFTFCLPVLDFFHLCDWLAFIGLWLLHLMAFIGSSWLHAFIFSSPLQDPEVSEPPGQSDGECTPERTHDPTWGLSTPEVDYDEDALHDLSEPTTLEFDKDLKLLKKNCACTGASQGEDAVCCNSVPFTFHGPSSYCSRLCSLFSLQPDGSVTCGCDCEGCKGAARPAPECGDCDDPGTPPSEQSEQQGSTSLYERMSRVFHRREIDIDITSEGEWSLENAQQWPYSDDSEQDFCLFGKFRTGLVRMTLTVLDGLFTLISMLLFCLGQAWDICWLVFLALTLAAAELHAGLPRVLWFLVLVLQFQAVSAVTCHTCFDQLPGCAGGAACRLLAGVTENSAVAVATAGTALFSLSSLLPRSYLKVFTRQVMDTLLSVIRRPLPGAVPDIRGWDIAHLLRAFRDQTVPRGDIVMELTTLIPAASPEERLQLQVALDSMKLFGSLDDRSQVGSRDRDAGGACLFLWALAGRVAARSGEYATISTTGGEADTGATSTSAKISEKVTRSPSQIDFSERMSIFSSTAHALGYINILVSTAFFRQVAYDPMIRDKYAWQLAHELVLVYLEDVDNTPLLNLGNVFDSGGQDVRLSRAKTAAQAHYRLTSFRSGGENPRDTPNLTGKQGGEGTIKWNGRFSPDGPAPCISYNKNTPHPQKHLKPDGTCKYNHVCSHWVTGKGKDGRCENSAGTKWHKWGTCDHPDKTDVRPVA